MNDVLALAEENQGKAWRVVEASGLIAAWESIGAEVHLVGSLKTGLLMKHRDIDFHIYTAKLEPEKSFAAMAKIAANPAVERVTYGNLAATDEHCFEWHAWFRDADGELWQLDMIQIERGTFYDGYFERVAERISAVLTPELKLAILTLAGVRRVAQTSSRRRHRRLDAVTLSRLRNGSRLRQNIEALPEDSHAVFSIFLLRKGGTEHSAGEFQGSSVNSSQVIPRITGTASLPPETALTDFTFFAGFGLFQRVT